MKTQKQDGGALLELEAIARISQRLRQEQSPSAAAWQLLGLELIEEISSPIPRPVIDRLIGHVALKPRATFHGLVTYLE